MGEDRVREFGLDDGWVLRVDGTVIDDGGFSGGHWSGDVGLLVPHGTPHEDAEAARGVLRDAEAARAQEEITFRLELVRGDLSVVVHEERRAHRDGVMELYWPPIVGPSGVLLRRSVATLRDSTAQPPWLVAPDGAVHTLPFELGVAPLCVLPDGRFLLPGMDPLWRDDFDEPLGMLSMNGATTPLRCAGRPVTPSRLVGLADPAWPTKVERDADGFRLGDFEFEAQRARVLGTTLEVLLADDTVSDRTAEMPLRWLIATIDLDGDAIALQRHGVCAASDAFTLPW